jgi:hypothetical protein
MHDFVKLAKQLMLYLIRCLLWSIKRITFGMELLGALEAPHVPPCPAYSIKYKLDRLPTGNPFWFWWPGHAHQSFLGCWALGGKFLLSITGEVSDLGAEHGPTTRHSTDEVTLAPERQREYSRDSPSLWAWGDEQHQHP